MLASMSEIDPRVDMPKVNWSDLGVSGLLPKWVRDKTWASYRSSMSTRHVRWLGTETAMGRYR
jgi:hypothetical protein